MNVAPTTAAAIYGRPTLAKRVERGVFWLLRLSTYFVLCCAAFIFYDIGTKGGRVIFQRSAPFINVPFLTEAPETLNVFELNGEKRTMGDRAFRKFKAAHEAELKGARVETYVYSAGGIFPNIVGTVSTTPATAEGDPLAQLIGLSIRASSAVTATAPPEAFKPDGTVSAARVW